MPLILGLLLLLLQAPAPALLTASDLQHFESPEPDQRIPYGSDPLQFGELRLPEGKGPHPVAILIHGGCWLSQYDVAHSRKLAAALTGIGLATWSLEYRRVGNEGGGWPGTLLDVAAGADHLRSLAKTYPLDLGRVLAVGHSAGGHLALWLAARRRIADREPFRTDREPLVPRAVLALAPAPDLAYLQERQVCEGVVEKLLGGSPAAYPERYRMSSPAELVPLNVKQILVVGRHDRNWAPVGRRYFERARAAGDDVRWIEAPDSGHFEVIDPESSTWPLVRDAALELIKATKAPSPVPR
jgi:acetyl esterase/lipase